MTDNSKQISSDVEQALGLDQKTMTHKQFKLWLIFAVVVLLGIGWFALTSDTDTAFQYNTVNITQGDLTITVTATGKLEPVNQVEVSTEVSGTIESVEVDFNDQVTVNQVLARLDTEQLEARFRQSQASLDLAKARVSEMDATVTETYQKFLRCQKLVTRNMCPQEEYDAANASYKRAQAGRASAVAQVTQSKAQLDVDQTALDKAVVHSPINGIVLKRSVEPGQTVAASFQAPVLFTLAEDLTKMELHVDIDEADVGQVKAGQQASFSVDAYPSKRFSAHILKVYFSPKVVQDVVTYEALLSVDNSELLLRPGMTATADIVIKHVNNALLVPNAALRFTPPQTVDNDRSMLRSLLPGPRGRTTNQRKVVLTEKTQQRVWTLDKGQPVSHVVTIGVTDGRMTEILQGDIQVGMPLLVDAVRVP